jgi:CHAT domain-containing protein
MSLNAEMVVLSACNSGYGKIRNGEGIMSIARAFAYAGCQSLISSLWKVPDHATKNIMVNFYTHLEDDKKKDQALQQAKLQYLQETTIPHAHPLYWAGFIAIGDMKPIHHEHPIPITYWHLLGSILLLTVGIFMWRRNKKR